MIFANGGHIYRYVRDKTVMPAAKQHDMPRHSVKPMALSDLSTLGDSNFKLKNLESVHRHLVGGKVGISVSLTPSLSLAACLRGREEIEIFLGRY